jgi:hypothetical protein
VRAEDFIKVFNLTRGEEVVREVLQGGGAKEGKMNYLEFSAWILSKNKETMSIKSPDKILSMRSSRKFC